MIKPKPEEYAAIYARRSTKLENHSIDSQIALAKDVIKEKNLIVYDIYSDKESATKYHPLHRSGFKKLLYDAMQGKFKTVVVFRRDRLARKVEDLIEIKNTFKKNGIKIVYSNKGEFQADESVYISSFIENIIMSVDELEPSILAERIASGKKEKRERGEYVCGGKHLYGYDRIEGSKITEYSLNDEESMVVKTIFEKFLKIDESNPDFDKFVEEINTVSPKRNFELKDINNIILKPVYAGKLILNERDSEGHKITTKDLISKKSGKNEYEIDKSQFKTCINVTKTLDPETWFESVLKWRRLTPERTVIPKEIKNYLFKGLLKCGVCNKNIFLSGKRYLCPKSDISIEKDTLTELLLVKLMDEILSDNNIDQYYIDKMKNIDNQIEDDEYEISLLKSKQNTILIDLISNYPISKQITSSGLNNLIDDEKNKKDFISNLKEEAVTLKVAIEKLRHIIRINHKTVIINMLKKNVDGTQYFLSSIIEEVTIVDNDRSKFKYKHTNK